MLMDMNDEIAQLGDVVAPVLHFRGRRGAVNFGIIVSDKGGGGEKITIRLAVPVIPEIMDVPGE